MVDLPAGTRLVDNQSGAAIPLDDPNEAQQFCRTLAQLLSPAPQLVVEPQRPGLSIVIPVYEEEQNFPVLHERLTKVMRDTEPDYEIVFVDDGSRDRSVEIVRTLAANDPRVLVVELSRNFGRALREDEATKDIPIVMLTGLGDTPSKLQGFETGADDYLVKPVPARELAARLRRLITARAEASTRLHDQRLRVISESPRLCARNCRPPSPPRWARSTWPCCGPASRPMSGAICPSAGRTSGRWPPPSRSSPTRAPSP